MSSPNPSNPKLPPFVHVGNVLGVHGHLGHLRIQPITDNPERFSPGQVLYIDSQPFRIEETRSVNNELLVKLDGLGSLESARIMVHKIIEIPLADVPVPPKDTYYHFQLLDLNVYTKRNAFLGRLSEVLITGSNDVYVVVQEDQELLIPAISDVVLTVNIEDGFMVVEPPEGLLPRTLPPLKHVRTHKQSNNHH